MKILIVEDDLTVAGELNGASTLDFEGLSMDPSSHRVAYRDQVLTLSPKTYGILELLLGNPEKSFNSKAILSHLWASPDMPGEEAVRVHIKDLRQKLTALGAPRDLIKTQRRKGYRLNPLYATTVASPIGDRLTPPQIAQLNAPNEALQSTMEELRSTQAELQQKNQELQAIYAELEQRVIDRTAELQALYDHAPCGYHSLDVEGRIVQINETELGMFGYAREEMIGRKITDFYTSEGLQTFQANYPKFIQQGWIHDLKFTIVRKDGSLLPISLSANAVKDEAGHYLMSHSIVVDSSDRKRREASTTLLSELTASFSYPLSANEIIQTVGEKLNAYLNIAACNFCEIDEVHDQVVYLGHWHREGTPQLPDQLRLSEQVNPAFLQQIRIGETIVSHNIQTSATTNAEANNSIEAQAFIKVPFFKSGEWKYLFSIHQNSPRIWQEDEIELVREVANCMVPRIERAHTEIALRHNQEMFSTLVRNAPFGIYLIDAEFRLQQINRGAEAVFSNIEPLIGRDFHEILRIIWPEPFATEALNYFHHTLASGESYYSPVIIEQRANINEIQAYDWQIHRIILPDGSYGVVCYFYDLSEVKRAEEIIRRAAQRDAFLVTLSDAMRPIADPVELQAVATRTLGEYIGANRVLYFEICGSDYIVERDYVNGVTHLSGRYPIDSFSAKVLEAHRAGRTASVPDLAADPDLSPAQKAAYAAIQIAAHLDIPLVKGGEFVAGLAIHASEPREWTFDEITLSQEVAERTWAAVQRARTELILQQQIRQEYLLADIAQEIRQSLDLNQVLSRTVHRVRDLLNTDRVIFFRFRPDWNGEVIMESVGANWRPILSTTITDPCFNDHYIEPYRQGRISTIADIDRENLEPCHIELLKSFQVRANLVVPILVNESLWGLLIAHHCAAPREWQAAEIALLQRLSIQISIAIQQAELYQNLQTELTERQQAEQKIREQAALLDISSDAIFIRDLEHRILYWNQGAERLYGWTAVEAIGQKATELMQDNDVQTSEIFQTVLATGEWQGETRKFTRTGQELIIQGRWTLVRDEAGQPKFILTVNTDITEKKNLEAQFYHAQRLESLGTLASGIAHDLNNVLTPIVTLSQLLRMHQPDMDERSQHMLKLLEDSSKRGAGIVKQILAFNRGTEGERRPVEVTLVVREVVDVARQTFPKSIDIYQATIDPDLWLVSVDPTYLHQILMNLCVNARDAMPGEGLLTLAAENFQVDAKFAQTHIQAHVGNYVMITVADTGSGILPEVRDRIFDPFFTTKDVGQGTGLGLSTVLGIIKTYDGFIEVQSQPGMGSQFQVYLPAIAGETTASEASTDFPQGQGELILVVDDEIVILESTQAILEAYNYKVITASEGASAIAMYREHQDEIRAVLMDMMMPNMSGITAIQTLQAINPTVKIIATSGLAGNYRQPLQNLGITNLLTKPFNAAELIRSLSL